MAAGPIRRSINTGEKTLRSDIANMKNMAPSLQAIDQNTGAPGAINANEIPMVGMLANQAATSTTASQARADLANKQINALPQYKTGYRAYLKWRYPNRYGGGSSNGYQVVTGGGGVGNPVGGLPTLPPITELPGS